MVEDPMSRISAPGDSRDKESMKRGDLAIWKSEGKCNCAQDTRDTRQDDQRMR